jgi:hypothetical protein
MPLKALAKIPIVGVVFVIVNSYVWGGNFSADEKFAPLWRWLKVLGPAVLVASGLTLWMLWPVAASLIEGSSSCLKSLSAISQRPGELAVSILPNVLGFGIGVYALIFVLSEKLLNGFHAASMSRDGSTALAINADMAYPLLIMLAAIGGGILQQRSPESIEWVFASWFLLWYALVLALCLVSSLFRLGEVSIVEKIIDDNPGEGERRN